MFEAGLYHLVNTIAELILTYSLVPVVLKLTFNPVSVNLYQVFFPKKNIFISNLMTSCWIFNSLRIVATSDFVILVYFMILSKVLIFLNIVLRTMKCVDCS